MADSTFLAPIIANLVQLLLPEVKSMKHVRRDVESLKKELEIIQSFLKDADARSKRGSISETVKTWVKHVREEADRIEDVIDEYLRRVAQRDGDAHRSGFAGSLRKMGHLVKGLKPRYDIASEIQNIKVSIEEIKDRGQRYGLSRQSLESQDDSRRMCNEHLDNPRIGSHFIREHEFLDVNSSRDELVSNLIEGESMRMVISLVGEGGIGKTTLAKKAYEEVKEHFDCYAWITVSQSYDMEKLLKIMMKQIRPTAEYCATMGEMDTIEGLITPLRWYLQIKRYVIVFDDVWREDFWLNMKHVLPINDNGSKIIITTRNATLAASFKETPYDYVKMLETWSPELAWKLFCKKAFGYDFNGNCPQELEELSHRIVRKCQGLPLVISAIASLLSTKNKVKFEWQRVLDNLDSEFTRNLQLSSVLKTLSLSYHDLPSHLKYCFLYFGIFPKDYAINDRMLYQLWIAEGFVEARSDKTLEEVAEEYLNELINRHLVGFELRYGRTKWCGVHDLMREIIHSSANELCFSQHWDDKKSTFVGKARRLSVYNSLKNVLAPFKDSGVRSIFLFDIDESSMSYVVPLLENFKLLKVLDFAHSPLENLPKEVGNLFHLKYLNLKGTNIKMLPKSIGKLYNLQTLNLADTSVKMLPKTIGKLKKLETLDLTNTSMQELPIQINKLRNLRHLHAMSISLEIEYTLDSILGVKIQEKIGCLENLETLMVVRAQNDEADLTKELEKLSKLKSLGISNMTTETGRAVCTSIDKMKNLQYLVLLASREGEILDLRPISSPSPFLQDLIFLGKLEEYPGWISTLWNLQSLRLFFSRLNGEPLEHLKGLPNLANLVLFQAYDGEQLHFDEGSFRKLEKLTLRKLEGLKLVNIAKGALPLLTRLQLGPCPQMEEVPAGVQHLRSLKQLQIIDMSNALVLGVQPDGGPHHSKIKHVPSVQFSYRVEGVRHHKVYKLGESDLLDRLQG